MEPGNRTPRKSKSEPRPQEGLRSDATRRIGALRGSIPVGNSSLDALLPVLDSTGIDVPIVCDKSYDNATYLGSSEQSKNLPGPSSLLDVLAHDNKSLRSPGARYECPQRRVSSPQSSPIAHSHSSSPREMFSLELDFENPKTLQKDVPSTKEQKDLLNTEVPIIYKSQKTEQKEPSSPKTQKDKSIAQKYIQLDAVKECLDETYESLTVAEFDERYTDFSEAAFCLTSEKSTAELKRDLNKVKNWPSISSEGMTHNDYCDKNALWRKIKHRIIALRMAELQLCQLNDKASTAIYNIKMERKEVDALITKFSDRWVAQSGEPKRKRQLTDDCDLRYLIERGDPPAVEYTAAYNAACEILAEIEERCTLLGILAKNLSDSEEKSFVRESMYDFYRKIDNLLNMEAAVEDLSRVFTQWNMTKTKEIRSDDWWSAQSHDTFIRHCKIQERISQSVKEKGLGKSRKKGHTSSKCYFRPGESNAARPTSSFRSAARDKFQNERDAKRSSFEAQAMFEFGLNDEAKEKIDAVIGEVSKLNEAGITLNVDIMSTLKEQVKNIFSGGIPAIKYLAIGVSVAFCAYKAYTTRDAIWKFLTTIISLAAACLGLKPGLLDIIEKFRTIADAREGTVEIEPVIFDADNAEGWEAQSGPANNISTFILMYVYGSIFSDITKSKNKIVEYLKRTSDVPKWRAGLTSQIDFFTSLIQRFLNFLSEKFGMKEYTIQQLPYPEAYKFAEEADKLSRQFSGGLDLNYENGQMYYSLEAKGRQIMTAITSSTPEGRDARNMILVALASMKTIGTRLARANIVNNGPRIKPIGVMLAGPSGVGKSDLMQFYMNAVTAQVIPENQIEAFRRNHNDVTFTRVVGNGYWEGYHGQFNVYTDDLGQTKDIAGQPDNEYMEHIHMLNSGNYPLNMANLEDKGNVNFRSKAVYATTNRTHFELQSLMFNEPFCRRFTVAYVMVPKPEYCIPESLSTDNLFARRISHFPEKRDDRSHLEFYKWNPDGGKISGAPISYEELVALTVAEFKRTNIDGAEMMELHQGDKERELRKRQKAIEAGPHAQAGGDIEQPDVPPRPVPTPPLSASDDFKSSMPEGLNFADTDRVIKTLAQEAKLSEEFAKKTVIAMQPLQEPWAVLVARLIIKAEDVQHTPAKSTDSLTTSICRAYIEKCKPLLEKAIKTVADNKLIISAMIAALAGIRYTWTYLGSLIPEAQSVGGMRHGKRDMSKPVQIKNKGGEKFSAFSLKPGKGKSNRGHVQLRGHRFEPQANSDGNVIDIMRKVMKQNQYSICLPGSEEPLGRITFIKGTTAICPLHFGERMQYGVDQGDYDDSSCVTIWSVVAPEARIQIPITQLKIIASEEGAENDWCLIRFPPVVERLPDIRKYWAEDTRLADRGKFKALLTLVDKDVLVLQGIEATPREGITEYEDYQMTRGYQYDYPTTVGSCGGLLAQVNSQVPCGKIVGIHTAGTGYKGFAPRITRAAIDHALTGFDESVDDPITSDEMDEEFDPNLPDNAVEGFKAQCAGRSLSTFSSSSIRKSPLHNTYFKSQMAPAILRPVMRDGEVVYPMEKTRKKYCTPVKAMDESLLRVVSDYLLGSMGEFSNSGVPWDKPKVFTFEEAVRGIPDIAFMEGIPRNTSAGYPFKLDVPPGHKGKSHFFGSADEYTFDSPYCDELRARVEDVVSAARKGRRKLHVFMDFLKDERRPIEKVRSVSTRMVSASPLDLLIVHRMYFLDFVRWIMHNRIGNGSAVGVNCYSSEWDLSAKRMLEVVKKDVPCMIAGDYSGFDGSITRQIECAVLQMILSWYDDPENALIRQVLWEEVCSSRHIFDTTIYQWCGSNPSGSFPTTILNTIVNEILIMYCFIMAYLRHHDYRIVDEVSHHALVGEAVVKARSHLRYMCYGDDNLIAVSEVVAEFFNQHTFTELLGEVGYKYTVESKDASVVEPVRHISEVSFLKRSFIKSEMTGRYVCPLELNVILEMPQWTTKKDVNFHDVKTNVETALKELSLHPRKVFDEYAPQILSSAKERLGFVPMIVDYNTLQAIILSSTELL